MRVHAERLPRGYRFACSRKQVAQAFGSGELDWVSFGAIGRTFGRTFGPTNALYSEAPW